jgi:energy-coupling factor transporter ATP-binding protein EcfA2
MSTGELRSWFNERPLWIQEAAKRLFEKSNLETQDIKELAELCCSEATGSLDSGYTLPEDAFLSGTSDSLRLYSIGEINNINALAPKSPLCFGDGNLSVIYGLNGSGKSGYVRILKHACGSPLAGTLYSNIYSTGPSTQQCCISYEKSGSMIKRQWIIDTEGIEDLCSLDIFDASCGQVYIADENEVKYEPPVLSFFSALISVCERVCKVIDTRTEQLVSKKPVLPQGYASALSGQWYEKLSKDTRPDEIASYCNWNEADQGKLAEVEKRLSEQSPAERVKQLRTQKQHADTLIQGSQELLDKLSDENCRRILAAKKQSLLKEQAAKTAASRIFADSSLNGIGSDVWKQLWEQARKYSEEYAYKELVFPYVDKDARCVLCHQPLSEESKKRFKSFENFIKGEMQKNAQTAKKQFEDALENVGELPATESITTKADAVGLAEDQIIPNLEELYTALRRRKDQLLTIDSVEDVATLPQYEELLIKLRNRSLKYEESALNYEEDAKKDNRVDLNSQRVELQTRKWLSEQREAIEAEISRIKQIDTLMAAKKLTNTTGLSRKKSELADTLITKAFINRFDNELKTLGADRIKVKLTKTKTDKGRVLHRLLLHGAERQSPQDILSEGEHRIVALAAFLADVGEKQNAAPFVFDDPISSLDQDFEEAVVQRLVKLSEERQVIVFTHRLSFLGLVQEYAEKVGWEPNVVCVRQESWGSGEPGDTPLLAAKPKKANNILLDQRLSDARTIYERDGKQTYNIYAQSLCSEFRILLEKTIEYDLLADVIQRFRRAVNTKGKLYKLSRITEADCRFFDDMMTKYSRYEHSQPGETPVTLPLPDELQQDMETLKRWRNEFLKRETQ